MDQGKALVVGATGGMGSAIATGMAAAGFDCALMGRDEAAVRRVTEQCAAAGMTAYSVICDLAETSTIEAAVGKAIESLGGLNFLINCAGISIGGMLHEVDPVKCDRIMDINLRAHYYLVRYAAPEINKTPGGAIVKIGAVHHPYSGVNAYLAANLGGEGYAEALFEDVREYGTRVCTIKPGWVNTPLVNEEGIDKALMIQPQDILQTVLFMISMPQTACPTEITILPQRSPYC